MVTFFFLSHKIHAQGMLIPKDSSLEPLELKSHRVEVEILDGVSKTTLTQVFHSNCSSSIEATYIFPLPSNAAVSNFAIWIDGKKKNGEILEKDEAEKIYQQIVSRLKDPGILDYMGGKVFRARIFPIPPGADQKVEISFTQTLPFQSNMYKYVYPLKTSGKPAVTKEDFTFTAKIKAQNPIKTIYSPTHKIDVQMNGAKEAVVGFEQTRATLENNFILYYSVSEDRIGLSVLTHKTGATGTFFLMLSPGGITQQSEVVAKNITFVLDTSGSMNGDKIKGAKESLKWCLEHLESNEEFNVIRFSSTAQAFFEKPVTSNRENKKIALEKIGSINAAGGTAIESALRLALSQKEGISNLPHFVIFITDGMPTVGMTEPKDIIKMVSSLNSDGKSRIFAFGLGEDVNANFLDMLTSQNHGYAQYIESGEKIENAVKKLYDAVAHPAMTDVELTVEEIDSSDIFPQKIPDLFYGEQITIAGRYAKGGNSKIILTGRIGNKLKKITYTRQFPANDSENEFIDHIWATRKVGYLLDQIRLNGESSELRDEVIALARTYGIVTPYTSYLVVEDNIGPLEEEGHPLYDPHPTPPTPMPPYIPPPNEVGIPYYTAPSDYPKTSGKSKQEEEILEAMDSISESKGSLSSPGAMGKKGAQMSKVLSEMKNAQIDEQTITKTIGEKVFILRNGIWIDTKYQKNMKLLKIKFGSPAYFTLLKIKPDLKKILTLGTEIMVVVGNEKAIAISLNIEKEPNEETIIKFLK